MHCTALTLPYVPLLSTVRGMVIPTVWLIWGWNVSKTRWHASHAAVLATLHLPASWLQEASKVEAEALAIYQQNQQLNKQQLGLHSEVKALKAQANQLADQAAQQKFELMNAQQENERLQSQIVQVRHVACCCGVTADRDQCCRRQAACHHLGPALHA